MKDTAFKDKKSMATYRRRNKKAIRTSTDTDKKMSNNNLVSNIFREKMIISPSSDDCNLSYDNSSIEAMNILNGYLELKGQYGMI